MKKAPNDKLDGLWQRLLYGLLVGVVLWYAHLLPITMAGYWRNMLIPGISMFTGFVHVYLIIAVWVVLRSKRSVIVSTIVVTSVVSALQFALGSWPTMDMIPKFGVWNFVMNWEEVLLPGVVVPVCAALLLAKADVIGPKVIRQWRRVYA